MMIDDDISDAESSEINELSDAYREIDRLKDENKKLRSVIKAMIVLAEEWAVMSKADRALFDGFEGMLLDVSRRQ